MTERIRVRIAAETERCEIAASNAVMAALGDMVPDHFDDEGRQDGYTIKSIMEIATRVALAIRRKPEPMPTAEERDWVDKMLDDPVVREGFLTELARQHEHAIHAAESAMQERCAEVAPSLIECPLCRCLPTKACCSHDDYPLCTFHDDRWRAAIRALGRTVEKEEPK